MRGRLRLPKGQDHSIRNDNPGRDLRYRVLSAFALRDSPVDLLPLHHCLVILLMRAEAERLFVAEAQHSPLRQAVVEEVVHPRLERGVEVDHHIAAQDRVELVERRIGDEVVLGEDEVALQRASDDRMIVSRGVVVGKIPFPASLLVVARILRHDRER